MFFYVFSCRSFSFPPKPNSFRFLKEMVLKFFFFLKSLVLVRTGTKLSLFPLVSFLLTDSIVSPSSIPPVILRTLCHPIACNSDASSPGEDVTIQSFVIPCFYYIKLVTPFPCIFAIEFTFTTH